MLLKVWIPWSLRWCKYLDASVGFMYSFVLKQPSLVSVTVTSRKSMVWPTSPVKVIPTPSPISFIADRNRANSLFVPFQPYHRSSKNLDLSVILFRAIAFGSGSRIYRGSDYKMHADYKMQVCILKFIKIFYCDKMAIYDISYLKYI